MIPFGMQRVGTCSRCGGDVVGHRGVWMSVTPPPPDRCSSCGAVRADDVIQMSPPPVAPRQGSGEFRIAPNTGGTP